MKTNDPLLVNRRSFLAQSAAVGVPLLSALADSGKRMGVSIASYGIRWRGRGTPAALGWRDALDVVEHCGKLGAGCLQIGVSGWDEAFAGKVRERREQLDLLLEGQISLPRDESDVGRFQMQVDRAGEAGAGILRTVCLGGRRYESFQSFEAWKEFRELSRRRLALAEPVMRKAGAILAVENHKDWRTEEFLTLLKEFDSEFIRVNFDFGNNLALLEDPHQMAEALAPWIVTTHLKDMAGVQNEEGFLLSEVPLGEGMLDLSRLIATCQRSHPATQFNLEMITRDPLRIPCFGKSYWATMPDVRGKELATTLKLLRNTSGKLPQIAGLDARERVAFEEENVRSSFAYSVSRLPLKG